MKYPTQFLTTFVWYLVAPVLYHTSADGSSAYYCLLLTDFVDAYASFIIVTFFIVMFLIFKNYLLKVFSNSRLFDKVPSSVKGKISTVSGTFYNTYSSTFSTLTKVISYVKKKF